MIHRSRSNTRRRCRISQGAVLVGWGVAALVALAAPAELYANQVFKACGSKWLRKVNKLDAAQKAWLVEQRVAEFTVDLDGDGSSDMIRMTSNPSFRDCDIKTSWHLKETTVRIELGNGKIRLFFWINPHLAEKMTIVRASGRILVSGVDASGRSFGKWIDYRKGAPPSPTLIAEREDAEAKDRARVADLQPQPVANVASVAGQ